MLLRFAEGPMNPPSLAMRRRRVTGCAVGAAVGGAAVGGTVVGEGPGPVAHAATRPMRAMAARPRRAAGKREPDTGAPAAGFELPPRRRDPSIGSRPTP